MLLTFLLALWGLLTLGLCNPCNDHYTSPTVYKVYGNDVCPPIRHFENPGSPFCETPLTGYTDRNDEWPCKGWCEVKTTYVYDQEIPLPGTYGRGWTVFGTSEWFRVGTTWPEPILFPGAPRNVIERDISGGYSRASRGLAKIDHIDLELDDNECGYATFLPINKLSCGTYSTSGVWNNCKQNTQSWGNECVAQRMTYGETQGFYAYTGEWGEPTVIGHTVWVKTDCNTAARLPYEKQHRDYQHAMDDGKHLGNERYEGWRAVWKNEFINNRMQGGKYGVDDKDLGCWGAVPEADKSTKDANWIHCQYRIDQLMREPEKLLDVKKAGSHSFEKTWWGSCNIYVSYKDDWDQSCKVTQGEVAAAASLILFSCMQDYGVVKGYRRYGVKGSHTLRTAGCEASIGVWGGKGSGIGGAQALGPADVAHLDPKLQYEVLHLPNEQPPIGPWDNITSAEYRDAFFPNETRAYVVV